MEGRYGSMEDSNYVPSALFFLHLLFLCDDWNVNRMNEVQTALLKYEWKSHVNDGGIIKDEASPYQPWTVSFWILLYDR